MHTHRDKAKVSYNCCERLILVLRTVSVELGKGQYRKCSHTVIVVDTHVHPLSVRIHKLLFCPFLSACERERREGEREEI